MGPKMPVELCGTSALKCFEEDLRPLRTTDFGMEPIRVYTGTLFEKKNPLNFLGNFLSEILDC